MTPHELMHHLRALGIILSTEAGRLRVNAPKGSLTEELKNAISANKASLIEILSNPAAPATIARVNREDEMRLTGFQERLWVLQRLEPSSCDFNLVSSWRMAAPGGLAPLVAAFRAVIARHEILRSRFVEVAERIVMQPQAAESVTVQTRDLNGQSHDLQQQTLQQEFGQQASRPFDLTAEAPLRVWLFDLGKGEAAVLLGAHHIALDAWSLSLLRREIEARAVSPEQASAVPELQFADFAAWQRSIEDGPIAAASVEWWTRKLAGAPELSLFPPDRSEQTRSAAIRNFRFDAPLSAGIRALARHEGATVYMVLLAATAAVLRWHTGQAEAVLASPQGVRERPELESMIGPFVNLLLVRLDMTDNPPFAELVRRARGAMLDADEHRLVPFERIMEKLRPHRVADHSPLFQMAIVYHNVPLTDDSVVVGGGALHEMTLFVRDVGEELACAIEYRADMFSDAAISRVAQHLEAALRGAVANRESRLSELPLLDAAEREKLLREFNATAVASDEGELVTRFERAVAANPTAVAVSYAGQKLSYGDLNTGVNQLARHLRALGVGPGVLVAVCLHRTPALCAALLAVLKAGGAYVPLDPGFPRDRLEFMLADSGAKLLVTSADAADGVALPAGTTRLDLDAAESQLASVDAENPAPAAGPDDIAYVIYTSGSTGRPKGVKVPRGALSNFLNSMAREPGLDASDVLAAVTTISFDIAGLELYLPLIVGARIELVPRETAADGPDLAALLSHSGATVLQATPATWRLLIEAGWTGGPAFRALCGGEALPRDLAESLLTRVSELWNLYGPTETTIWSTAGRIESATAITIGRPIANTQIYLREPAGNLVPIGIPGEICIGGDGVALGYHHRPELTAEKFVADPYSSRPNARLYRTGDLGRWREDGRLEHLGRLDHQVKIRGFRIELGEIETVMAAHPAVRQAVAVALEAAPGDLRLVAYVVYQPGEDLTVSDARRHLRATLPDYMIPALIVALDAIPLTPNGKVNRAALPDPFKASAAGAAAFTPPAPGLETTIAAIWTDVLKVERVGANDNFFELGGHSLLSLRVAAAVEKAVGWRMDPRILFFQTLSQIASLGVAATAKS